MKTTPLTGNLVQLTRFGLMNAYLVREPDGFTLVDTTMGKVGTQLIEAARAAGGEIRRVALTHGHGDHVGGLDDLKATLGDGVEVLMPELDARILAGEKVTGGRKLTGSWPTVHTAPDVRLAPGDRVGSLEVVATPGHTPGHISFLDTRDRSLIAGDVFTTFGGPNVTDHLFWRFPFAAMATYDRAQDRESACTLRRLEPTLLAVGHGPAIGPGGPGGAAISAIDAALARAGR